MKKPSIFSRFFDPVLGIIIGFLGWFIRLVALIGDVTIWAIRLSLRALITILKQTSFDPKKKFPGLFKSIRSILQKPIFAQDRNFKIGLLTIVVVLFALWYFTKDLPSPKKLENREVAQTTKIYDRNEKLLYNVYTDQNRTVIHLSDIPESLKLATIAIEDKDFYSHKGFDVYGIIRAAQNTLFRSNLQGGSTITQQLVKSVFLSPERTVDRKIKELYLAFRVEMAYSKDQILEMYLNQVPYGGTAWGVAAASEQYFGKKPKDLDLAESALLAGLPQAPSYYSPFGTDPTRAKHRQLAVLNRMIEDGYIKREQADEAGKEELKYQSSSLDIRAPHFVMFVREYLAQKYGETAAAQGGMKVVSTLDLDLQEEAQRIVRDNVEKLQGYRVGNGAALITKPGTGEILSMVGSKDFFNKEDDGNVNVTLALRQPGSSIKPINYGLALERHLITPATIIMDVATTFSSGPKPYSPVNYDGKFHGPVTVRQALANSFNIPAVKVLAVNGVPEMIDQARKMGITTFEDPSRYGLSLTLGGGEVRMTEMATAFGVFANEGKKVDLTPILKITDSSGKVLEEYKPKQGTQVLSREASFLISSIISDNNARAQAFGTGSGLAIRGKTVAVKTGTTDDKRDNWAIGYTPSYLVAAWVGNNDNTPMNPAITSGITGATPIWNQIMTFVLKDKINETFKVPSGVAGREICSTTGGQKTDQCGGFEYFIAGTEPKQDTFKKAKVWVDKTTGQVVEPNSPNAEEREVVVVKDIYSKRDFCVSCPRPSETPGASPAPNSPPVGN